MAYLANAFAPQASGLAAVWYNTGAESHLSGLNAVAYDNGGRLRVLLGQDPSVDMPPPDVPIDTSILNPLPIDLQPVTPAPTFLPTVPAPVVDTTSAPITGGLIAPAQQAAPISGSLLTDILNAAKTIVPLAAGASTGQAAPQSAGTVVTTAPGGVIAPTSSIGSWFSGTTAGVPNIVLVLGIPMLALLAGSLASGGGSRRRRNPAELILMGANPRRRSRR